MLRLFPREDGMWGKCQFLFDWTEEDYDWLVVYDDLPNPPQKGAASATLATTRDRTIFLSCEPTAIKTYGSDFLSQFGWVLTSQDPWAIRHPHAIFTQVGLAWFYGRRFDTEPSTSYTDIANRHFDKKQCISTVCSDKKQRHTRHYQRYLFTQKLSKYLNNLEVFGHGVRTINDKSEAIDHFKYHLAIENYSSPHYWTEKLSDAFLGMSLPFYDGGSAASEYFPEESFIRIDIRDFDKSLHIIKEAIANHAYEKRLDCIVEARRRVLEEHNMFASLSRFIEKKHALTGRGDSNEPLLSRKTMRGQSLYHLLRFAWERGRNTVLVRAKKGKVS